MQRRIEIVLTLLMLLLFIVCYLCTLLAQHEMGLTYA